MERLNDSPSKVDPLNQKNDELISILVDSIVTAKKSRRQDSDEIAYEAQ